MTAPPTVAGGTWTTVYDTSSSPTPHFEDFTAGITGVRLRVLSTQGNAGVHLYGVFQPRPGSAYDLIGRFRIQKPVFSSYNTYGLMMRESSTGKLMIFGWSSAGGIGRFSASNTHTLTNFGGLDGDNARLPTTFEGWLRIHDDHAGTGGSGNVTFYTSIDGNYWVKHLTQAYNSTAMDFTSAPDQVGFGFDVRDESTSTEIVLDCGSFFAG